MTKSHKQFWLVDSRIEKIGIILPGILSALLVFFLDLLNILPAQVNPITWLFIVVFVDVAHVWSTLYRTYLHKENKLKLEKPLWIIPIICYALGVFFYTLGPLFFWRVLAYIAVFHFIRQQYGLYSLYFVKESKIYGDKKVEVPFLHKICIYSCAVIPLLIWHFKGPQDFHWFIPLDFFYLGKFFDSPQGPITYLKILGPLIVLAYCIYEYKLRGLGFIKTPKFGIIVGTYLSWWTGIVWLGNDWSFTVTNVITHGLPYFTLIGLLHFYDDDKRQKVLWPWRKSIIVAIVLLIVLATLEEAFWDVFLWREQQPIFGYLYDIKSVKNLSIESLLVPLLAIPQATHYLLDGLIWRREGL